MNSQFHSSINGRRVVQGRIVSEVARRVRYHAIRKYGKLYWSCDIFHDTWTRDPKVARSQTTDANLDIVR